jgi:DNA-binding LytR/AlgR family response regulator
MPDMTKLLESHISMKYNVHMFPTKAEGGAQPMSQDRDSVYSVALCEDEEVFCAEHEKICRDVLAKLNTEYHIDVYKSADVLLAAFLNNQKRYNLILLDIIMDGMTGMELARAIRETDHEAVIIFITSSRKHVFEGYEVNALHYLTKPVDVAQLERLIRLAYTAFKNKSQDGFYVFKAGDTSHRISVKEIISAETAGRKVKITLLNNTLYYPGKLTELLDDMPKGCLTRCHNAFAVNMDNIRELTRLDCIAVSGSKIPISRAYIKEVQKAFLLNMQEG